MGSSGPYASCPSTEAGGPLIALTAHARESDGERAFAAGFQRYASKPVDLERLISMVANLCGISFGQAGEPAESGTRTTGDGAQD